MTASAGWLAGAQEWGRPLHGAVENGYPDVVKALLAAGADPNAMREYFRHPPPFCTQWPYRWMLLH